MSRFKLPKLTFWRAVLLIVLAAGFYSTVLRFTQGLSATTNLSDKFPWGVWIGFDVMCGVALAAGGFTLSAVVYVFHAEKYHSVIRPTILTAFLGYSLVVVALMFDLGRPYNVWHPLIMWNPHSVMFEVGWCVTLYSTVLALEFSPMVFERLRWQRLYKIAKALTVPLVILGVLLSTLHQSSLGTLYLIVPHKLHPLWYTPLLPVFFWVSAIALGCAMTIFESYLSQRAFRKSLEFDLLARLGRIAAVALFVYLVLKLVDLDYRGVLPLAFEPTYEGRMFLAEMLLGVVAPVVMLVIPRVRGDRLGLFIAALMVVLGFVMNRLNVSITGMDASSGANYFPSWTELSVTASIVAAGFVIFGLAVKYLNVFPAAEVEEIRRGRVAELPAAVLFRGRLQGPTILSLALGVLFVMGAAALGYAGVRARVPAPAMAAAEADVDTTRAMERLKMPADVRVRMGTQSPGQVVFSHEQHLQRGGLDCTSCHAGQFRMLPTTADAEPMKKMESCGSCHDGIRAVGIRDKMWCGKCHAPATVARR
jgi:c(7)-type cytochrome triheme protein